MKIRMPLVTLVISSLLCTAYADVILDEVMSKQEQKKMGIDKLSRKQKLELEAWLNKTFVLKTEAEKSEFAPLSLAINVHGGQRLQLSDNSVWEIDPDDIKISSGWISASPIKISSGKNPKYPYIITNTTSGASVKARHAQPPPSPPAPATETQAPEQPQPAAKPSVAPRP